MRVGVVGLGYVGLPLAVAFAERGHEVVGVDLDDELVQRLRGGESPAAHVPTEAIAAVGDRLAAGTDYGTLAGVEAIVIAVPTPLDRSGEPDHTALSAAAVSLAEVLVAGQLVSIESTTYPGCTRERLRPLLERSGLDAGTDFHLAFSPERLSVARPEFTMARIPKVVGGLTERCRARAVELFAEVCESVVPVSSLEAAEACKLLENAFRFVNAAFVNEFSLICDRLEIDVTEVIDAAETKPFGFMRFDPGPGVGGHCLPVDSAYLAWRGRQLGAPTVLLDGALAANRAMPAVGVDRIERALGGRGLTLADTTIAVIGVTYKPGIADLRESPLLELIALLRDRGAKVIYHDELVPELPDLGLSSLPLEQALAESDIVALGNPHPAIAVDSLAERAPLLVDLRGGAPAGIAARAEVPR